MERRRITVFDKSKEFQKIEQNKCNEMIINDILNPLLQIIYAVRVIFINIIRENERESKP